MYPPAKLFPHVLLPLRGAQKLVHDRHDAGAHEQDGVVGMRGPPRRASEHLQPVALFDRVRRDCFVQDWVRCYMARWRRRHFDERLLRTLQRCRTSIPLRFDGGAASVPRRRSISRRRHAVGTVVVTGRRRGVQRTRACQRTATPCGTAVRSRQPRALHRRTTLIFPSGLHTHRGCRDGHGGGRAETRRAHNSHHGSRRVGCLKMPAKHHASVLHEVDPYSIALERESDLEGQCDATRSNAARLGARHSSKIWEPRLWNDFHEVLAVVLD